MYDHQCDDQQISSIDWQSNLWHCSIWNIYLIHFVNLQCGSEKNAAQSRVVIIYHTTLCLPSNNTPPFYSILHIPCNICSHLTNLVPTLHSYQRTNSFWCNRKTTILTEMLPPSYLFDAHPASFLLVHQLVNC